MGLQSLPRSDYLSQRYGDRDHKAKTKLAKKKKQKPNNKSTKKGKKSSEDVEDWIDPLSNGNNDNSNDEEEEEEEEEGPVVVELAEGNLRDETSKYSDMNHTKKNGGDRGGGREYAGSIRRHRYDSDDEDGNDGADEDENKQCKRRYDSDDNQEDNDNRRSIRDSRNRHNHAPETNPRQKNKKKIEVEEEEEEDPSSSLMRSEHRAGLQSRETFAETEHAMSLLQRQQHSSTNAAQHGGRMEDTVYRDQQGRVSQANHHHHRPNKREEREISSRERALLNTGRVQRLAEEQQRHDTAELAQAPLARYADDAKLEEMRKNTIREGDPMALYAHAQQERQQQQQATATATNETIPQPQLRPVYKGPPAKPNRFGIRPGFRWDGNDRGNGFEDRLLAQQYSRQHQREQAYRMRAGDM